MSEPILIQRQRAASHAFLAACARRADRERDLSRTFATRLAQLEKQAQLKRQAIEESLAKRRAQIEADLAEAESTWPRWARERGATLTQEAETQQKAITTRHNVARQQAEEQRDRARWEAGSIFEASTMEADDVNKERLKRLESQSRRLDDLVAATSDCLTSRRLSRLISETAVVPHPDDGPDGADEPHTDAEPAPDDPFPAIDDELDACQSRIEQLERLWLPRLLIDPVPAMICLVIAAALCVPLVRSLGWGLGLGLGLALALLVDAALLTILYRIARRQASRLTPGLVTQLETCESKLARAGEWCKDGDNATRAELKRQQVSEIRAAERRFVSQDLAAQKQYDEAATRLRTESTQALEAARSRAQTALGTARSQARKLTADLDADQSQQLAAFQAEDDIQRALYQADHEAAWAELENQWREAVAAWETAVDHVNAQASRYFPDWTEPDPAWEPPVEVPPGIQFGRFQIDRGRLAHGVPRTARLLDIGRESVRLPALLPFPESHGSLLVRWYGDGRKPAIAVLQSVMFRMLTSIPPGKLRFTIIDPVGLGQNFAGFMHLGDYDEALVNSRIWTEQAHIERKLADLTEHMETVIQKYLRNEFQSIQQYNEQAGEVAEPFRVLVVADFPVNFSESAARRLVSISQSGPRCGVFTLITLDERETLPTGVTLAELEAHSTVMAWREGRMVWKDDDFGGLPLQLDGPPEDAVQSRLLHRVGALARDASRVEVPFEVVAPAQEDWWSQDSSDGIDVPLGRVGANKLQRLRLGQGTSQHVLIAGRTGSGKSTLLHALVTNAALRYSPDELELDLIDFKKGVEFKTYVTHRLPHARVIAIESEREFGLSVLERLDREMKRRGEIFRAANVPNLAAYRESNSHEVMPRILLVVDEFQEFFVEDDKLSQEAALLLDRLVRQGRAFGIHALLGSQTLGGAFSLARSTLGQMAVRVALQCSETDAHLILSEDNPAARLLSRPGEAIYNDANGLIEGNNFFQVVWLPEDRREFYLNAIRRRFDDASLTPRQTIVFEGNVPADIARNPQLQLLQAAWPPETPPRVPQVWLGDAVAIKDPTAIPWRRQSGSNLLIVGTDDSAATGILLAALSALSLQFPPPSNSADRDPLRLFLLDGSAEDATWHGLPARLAQQLPHTTRPGTWRDTAPIIADLADELDRRESASDYDQPPWFLFVHDLGRLRDLRKGDDEYSFGFGSSGGEDKPNPAKQFARLLKDGPGFGLHTMVWCDSLNNLQRSLDRAAQREFEMRVLFQMSPNDSSALIDGPQAGRLGPNRALFAFEQEGILEKFRPYGPPEEAWWKALRAVFPHSDPSRR